MKRRPCYLADFKRHDKVLHVLGSIFLHKTFHLVHRAKGDGVVREERPIADGGAGSVVEQILLRACQEQQRPPPPKVNEGVSASAAVTAAR